MPQLGAPPPMRRRATELALAVECQLRALGLWAQESRAGPPPSSRSARGSPRAFARWLQFALVPLLRRIATGGVELPEQTSLGARAAYELASLPETDELEGVLFEVDRLIRGYRNLERWRASPLSLRERLLH